MQGNQFRPDWWPFPTEEEAGLARSSGLGGTWTVFDKYEIANGFIVPVGEPDRLTLGKTAYSVRTVYYPQLEKSLVSELAKVYRGTLTPLEFVNLFGLLGHDPAATVGMDPLDWFMAHARTVAVILDLMAKLGFLEDVQLDEKAIESQLRSLDPGAFAAGAGLCRIVVQFTSTPHNLAWATWKDDGATLEVLVPPGGVVQAAQKLIVQLINRNLVGITPTLKFDDKTGDFSASFTFQALFNVVYWHLREVILRGTLRTCEECGAPFIATDKRQRFCPPPEGVKESRCATRRRGRERYRNKKRNAPAE